MKNPLGENLNYYWIFVLAYEAKEFRVHTVVHRHFPLAILARIPIWSDGAIRRYLSEDGRDI